MSQPSSQLQRTPGGTRRRGPAKDHVPFVHDELERGKRTGKPIKHFPQNDDGLENFTNYFEETPSTATRGRGRPSGASSRTARSGGAKPSPLSRQVDDEDDEEVSMDIDEQDDSVISAPNAYFSNSVRPPPADQTRSISRTADVDYDRIPSPGPNSALMTRAARRKSQPAVANARPPRRSAAATQDTEDELAAAPEAPATPRRAQDSPAAASTAARKSGNQLIAPQDMDWGDGQADELDDMPQPSPSRKAKGKARAVVRSSADEDAEDEDDEPSPARRARQQAKGKGRQVVSPPAEEAEQEQEPDAVDDVDANGGMGADDMGDQDQREERQEEDEPAAAEGEGDQEQAAEDEGEEEKEPEEAVKGRRGRKKKNAEPKAKKAESQQKAKKAIGRPKKNVTPAPDGAEVIHVPDGSEAHIVDENGVRRNTRTRYKPLEYWRNERVVYGRRDSTKSPAAVAIIKDIIKLPPEPVQRLGIAGKRSKRKRGNDDEDETKKKRRRTSVESEDEESDEERGWDEQTDPLGVVMEYVSNREVERRVAFTEGMIEPREAVNAKFKFQKIFGDGEFLAAGMLSIPEGETKPTKSSKDNSYVFYVIQGGVKVQIHRTTFLISKGGMFLVPRGNMYLIKNVAHKESILFFAQARKIPEELMDGPLSAAGSQNNTPRGQGGSSVPPRSNATPGPSGGSRSGASRQSMPPIGQRSSQAEEPSPTLARAAARAAPSSKAAEGSRAISERPTSQRPLPRAASGSQANGAAPASQASAAANGKRGPR